MFRHDSLGETLSGSLLVAHPNLLDPNFRRAILFILHHTPDQGALGVILNRAMGKTLGEIAGPLLPSHLQEIPVFQGGPVEESSLIFASFQWQQHTQKIDIPIFAKPHANVNVPDEYDPELRAFLGYAGWATGQLEQEIAHSSWIVLAPTQELLECVDSSTAWQTIVKDLGPVYWLLAEMPDDPSLN